MTISIGGECNAGREKFEVYVAKNVSIEFAVKGWEGFGTSCATIYRRHERKGFYILWIRVHHEIETLDHVYRAGVIGTAEFRSVPRSEQARE